GPRLLPLDLDVHVGAVAAGFAGSLAALGARLARRGRRGRLADCEPAEQHHEQDQRDRHRPPPAATVRGAAGRTAEDRPPRPDRGRDGGIVGSHGGPPRSWSTGRDLPGFRSRTGPAAGRSLQELAGVPVGDAQPNQPATSATRSTEPAALNTMTSPSKP